ncbi:MAG: hypothetical protein RI956_356 [Pseudomonadota bacterium]|jgi:uncharacterized protein YxjI
MMQNDVALQHSYPIDFIFKITTLHDDFLVTDSTGHSLAYVKQKIFALKTAVKVLNNSVEQRLNYHIMADKWLAFNMCYSFNNAQGNHVGKILRKGVRSIWTATYEIHDAGNNPILNIKETNPWIKILDALFNQIPIVGLLTGYFFHPKYTVSRLNGDILFFCTKEASLFGRKFKLTNECSVQNNEEELAILGVIMMLLIEKNRG